ncbi:CubicO group peptidase, beta-lactamase class C family [Nonomuraea solani]|uniref:CubicO group peptidase, beta-lactamase class C family n=1 Tax=Nonomuraea solani TaxID=1144553 RepID=A0A1H6ELX8_9ACTN|nr:serine hydrolase domain-containing protein [Nonomuraea solani]SEG98862.1 CubicO group peptidase, beta-lactamase class C family [Nonomuraea solani]
MTSSRRERVQEVLDRAVAEGSAPGIVAEIQDQDGGWFGSAGVADLETGRRREPGEQFHAGSSGKAFTAAAMLTLEAEGRLSLDDTVDTWLPGVITGNGNDGREITIWQLLTHTGGLGITGLSAEIVRKYHTRAGAEEHRYDVLTVDELLKRQLAIPPLYKPGEDFAYSNGGYHIAGAIIEKATGRSYEDELDRTVIQPLKLTGTYARTFAERRYRGPHTKAYTRMFIRDGVDPDSLTPDNYASLLLGPESDPVDVTDRTIPTWAAGGVVSTTGDLIRLLRALTTGSLLPPAQHRTMWRTVPTRDWIPNARYGTGVAQWPLADGRVLHVVAGVEGGTVSVTLGTPDGGLIVSTHLNGDWNWYMTCYQIAEAAFGSPFLLPNEASQ